MAGTLLMIPNPPRHPLRGWLAVLDLLAVVRDDRRCSLRPLPAPEGWGDTAFGVRCGPLRATAVAPYPGGSNRSVSSCRACRR